MDKDIYKTLRYFHFFEYAPTFDELYLYTERKMTQERLRKKLSELIKQKTIKINRLNNLNRYTLGGYSREYIHIRKRQFYSKQKIKKIKTYLRILSFFPQIEFVGISGSVAMLDADKTDDIDLMVISTPHRMWTARFVALLTAKILGIARGRTEKRGQYDSKICLNLFFDGSNVRLPVKKRTLYGAHEVLQMKPVIDKSNAYSRFLRANLWVLKIFPNAKGNREFQITNSEQAKQLSKRTVNAKSTRSNFLSDCAESVLKKVQLSVIHRHQTTERITDTQLWFHPDDIEKRLDILKKM